MSDLRLNGINPLSYLGVNPYTPAPLFLQRRNPTQNDNQNFTLGTFWMNTLTYELWYLADLALGVATWLLLSNNGGAVTDFVTDDANTVTPINGIVNVFGMDGIVTTGSGNTITIDVTPPAARTSFAATLNAENNVTGTGNVFQIGSVAAATIIQNVGGAFFPGDGAGTPARFTAPVTGLYSITMWIGIQSGASDNDMSIGTSCPTPSASIPFWSGPTKNVVTGFNNTSGFINCGASANLYANANDTITFTYQANGAALTGSIISGYIAGVLLS